MKAAVYREFKKPLNIEKFNDPIPTNTGVVIQVKATGICRSDWHGWMGHDKDIILPHIPGHELAGIIVAVGKDVKKWHRDDRVTLPFVCGCGNCEQCHSGNHHICDFQFQPGFTHWGSFAEYVAIDYADTNLVALPDALNFEVAASLGCRFATSFRAIVTQGAVTSGQWVAVHGCGGVGMAAIMIAKALEARVIAIDIDDDKLHFAEQMGAVKVINARTSTNVIEEVLELTKGGVHVSLDALGSKITCHNSIENLRKRGKHIQVGLMLGNQSNPEVSMAKVIANELEIKGSHGLQAYKYQDMIAMIEKGLLNPEKLIGDKLNLSQGIEALINMNNFKGIGIKIINEF